VSSSKRVRGHAHLAPSRSCSRQQCPVSLPLIFVTSLDLPRQLVILPGHFSVRLRDLLLLPVFHQERIASSCFSSDQRVLTKVEV
jgi:hypothetical protein